MKVAGRWRYVYRAIDQFGQVIDVFVSPRREAGAARRFFERAIGTTRIMPSEVVTDQAPTYPVVLEELLPAAWHDTDRHANNHIEADHGRLKSRLRPMRGLKQDRSAGTVIAGHALVQNLRRGHDELAVEEPVTRRMAVAFVPAWWGMSGIQVGRGAGRGGDQCPGVPRRPRPAQGNARQGEPEQEQDAQGDEGIDRRTEAGKAT